MSDKLMESIKRLDAEIEKLEADRDEQLQRWAVKECPYDVGQIVDVVGYSYSGKRCLIGFIGSYCMRSGYQWFVRGNVLKSDGSAGVNTVCWNSRDEAEYGK